MKKWIKPILSLLGSVIALLMAHGFNIFSYMTFIPNDKQYDVCIAVYFTLFETLISMFCACCEKKINEGKTDIESVIYLQNEIVNQNNNPVIKFNDFGMAEMLLHVKVSGKCKKLKGNRIVLRSFSQADMQINRKGTGAKIDNTGNYIICLESFCGTRECLQYEEDYRIVLQRGAIDNSASIILRPELISDKKIKGIKHIANEAKVVLEEH